TQDQSHQNGTRALNANVPALNARLFFLGLPLASAHPLHLILARDLSVLDHAGKGQFSLRYFQREAELITGKSTVAEGASPRRRIAVAGPLAGGKGELRGNRDFRAWSICGSLPPPGDWIPRGRGPGGGRRRG